MSFAIMFHHFHGRSHSKSQGSISGKQFHLMLKFLKARYNLLSAEKFYKKTLDKTLEKKDVCITFDDCLKCQYDIALPILKRNKLSAFFFIYSSIFDKIPNYLEIYRDFRHSKFKNIEIFYQEFFKLLKEKFKKKKLDLDKKYKKNYLFKYKFYTSNDRKFRFCRDKIITNKDYEEIMFDMMKNKKYNYKKVRNKLFMSIRNLKNLKSNKHLIGLHSNSHPVNIYKLSYKSQYLDYSKNFNFIKKKLKISPKSMSHPFGRYNKDSLKVLKKLGIKIGFLSSPVKFIKSNLEIGRVDHNSFIKKAV